MYRRDVNLALRLVYLASNIAIGKNEVRCNNRFSYNTL